MNSQTQVAGPMVIVRSELQQMREQFVAALPKQIPVERFQRVVMTAIQNNPDLLSADRRSLWNAAIRAAQDGLLPDGREGAMVLYGKRAQFLPMVAGLRKKVRNSGGLATWDVYAVHEHDEFDFAFGGDPFIRHKPSLDNPGKLIAVYSIAILRNGEKSRDVMSLSEIERIRLRSRAKSDGPWVTDYEEMAKKTVARRHSKVLPMSTDLDDILRRDEEEEHQEQPEGKAPARLNSLEAFAAMDEAPAAPAPEAPSNQVGEINKETGEVLEPDKQGASPYALGMTARRNGRALRAVPGEWRDDEHQAEADAWQNGWRDADAEITKKAKGEK